MDGGAFGGAVDGYILGAVICASGGTEGRGGDGAHSGEVGDIVTIFCNAEGIACIG